MTDPKRPVAVPAIDSPTRAARTLRAPDPPAEGRWRRSSGCWLQVRNSVGEARWNGQPPAVQVRCFECYHRLFDVIEGRRFREMYGMVADGSLLVERVCPSCKRKNRGSVTASPGDPLPGGLDGPWYCECGKSIGYAEPVRGRIRATCRCRTESRIVAATAIKAADYTPHGLEVGGSPTVADAEASAEDQI